jgi:ATP adenylyltransferase
MAYIAKIDKTEAGCVFCGKVSEADDRKNLVLHRGKSCFVLMNLFPYNNGHLMVIPYAHVSEIRDIGRETSLELWELLCRSQEVLKRVMHPDGFNIGLNVGRVAGAGIDIHLHAHIVPRWNGDTNFMPVIGETKVISQALGATYDALLPLFQSMA